MRRFDPVKSQVDSSDLLSRLPKATLKSLFDVATSSTHPDKRWDQLSVADRLHITFATLMTYYGAPRLPLGSGPSKKVSFNVLDIVSGELVDLTPSFTLPNKITIESEDSDDDAVPFITALRCRADGGVDATLSLGAVAIRGKLNRQPGSNYYVLLAGSVAVSLAIPALAWVLPLMAAMGAFLADSANLEVAITNLRADVALDFMPDNARSQLSPSVKVRLSGDVDVSLDSTVPTGLHQLVDKILEIIAESGHILLDQLQAPLEEGLQDLIVRAIGGGIFTSMAPLGVKMESASARGKDDTFVYYEARLAPPTGAGVSAKTVRAYSPDSILPDAAKVVPKNHYVTIASSQNMLNVLLAGLRHSGMLGGNVARTHIADLQVAARKLHLGGKSVANIRKVRLQATNAPLTLATTTSAGSSSHGVTELGAVLIVECPERRFEWTLTLRAPVQVVIGSARTSTTETIKISTALDQPLDVLFDLAQATVKVQKLTVTEQVTRTFPSTRDVDPRGKPIRTGPETEVVDLPPTQLDLKDPKLGLTAHTDFVLKVVRLVLEGRDVRHSPRRDGTPGGKTDPLVLQSYTLNGKDPDGDQRRLFVRGDLSFDDGGLLLHVSLAGDNADFDDVGGFEAGVQLGVIAGRLIYNPPEDDDAPKPPKSGSGGK